MRINKMIKTLEGLGYTFRYIEDVDYHTTETAMLDQRHYSGNVTAIEFVYEYPNEPKDHTEIAVMYSDGTVIRLLLPTGHEKPFMNSLKWFTKHFLTRKDKQQLSLF